MARTNRRFHLPVTAPPNLSVPVWWQQNATGENIHPTGTWQVYCTDNDSNIPAANGTPIVGAYQKGASVYSIGAQNNLTQYPGGAIDPVRKRLYVTGGGHNTVENCVVCYDFGIDTPRVWISSANTYAGTGMDDGYNGYGVVPTDRPTSQGGTAPDFSRACRPASWHTINDWIFDSGYVYVPAMWGVHGIVYPGQCGTTRIFRFATNHTLGQEAVWETCGHGVGTLLDGYVHGEDGCVAHIESKHELWRASNQKDWSVPYAHFRLTNLDTYPVAEQFLCPTVAPTLTGNRWSCPAGFSLFESSGQAVELWPDASNGRPSMVLTYLNPQSWFGPDRAAGWFLFDSTDPSVMYQLTVDNQTGLAVNTHIMYGSWRHLHGTRNIYMNLADMDLTGATYKMVIPDGATAAELASRPWVLSKLNVPGVLPPTTVAVVVSGSFNLIQDMGDGRPAIVRATFPTSTFSSRPQLWILKMPVGGL